MKNIIFKSLLFMFIFMAGCNFLILNSLAANEYKETDIKKVKSHIYIRASIDDIEGWFILDTGATHTVLAKSLIEKLKAKTNSKEYADFCDQGVMGTDLFKIADFSFPKHNIVYFEDVKIDENSKKYDNMDCSGIIGINTLKNMPFAIDYENSKLRIYNKCIQKTPANTLKLDILENSLKKNKLHVQLSKNKGENFPFKVDTGAGGMLLSIDIAKKWDINPKEKENSDWNGVGTEDITIENWDLDQFNLKNVSASLIKDEETNKSFLENYKVFGFFGNKILKEFKIVTFDFSGLKIYLGNIE